VKCSWPNVVDIRRRVLHLGAWSLCLSVFLSLIVVAGCEKDPLDEPIEQQYLTHYSLEAHFPPQWLGSLGDNLLNSMVDTGMNLLHIPPSQNKQQDGNGAYIVLDTGAMDVALAEIHPSVCATGINFHLVFAPSQTNLDMEVSYMGQDSYQCEGRLLLPARETFVHMSLHPDSAGDAVLVLDGDPGLSGEPMTLSLDDNCLANQYVVYDAGIILRDALDEQLAQRLKAVVDELRKLGTSAFGLKMGISGKIGDNLLFELFAHSLLPSSSDSQDGNLLFSGGFDSSRAWCVPSNVSPVLPTEVDRAVFSDVVPGSENPYSVAISVSLPFIRQGLLSAYRAGLLCRQASEFSLTSVDPVELFMSLGELGRIDGMRVSTRPMGTPDVIWARPGGDSPGSLPDLYLVLPDVFMDVFVSIDGLDLRAFELKSDITVDMEPRLEQGLLVLDIVNVDVQKLEIEYNDLTTERAGELRQATTKLVEQVTRDLLKPLDGFLLDLPLYCGKNLLGYDLDEKHLTVYLGFTPDE